MNEEKYQGLNLPDLLALMHDVVPPEPLSLLPQTRGWWVLLFWIVAVVVLAVIKWMQKHGGLWPLDADTETKIVTYLAENYGPSGSFRRAPLPVSLLPENPYLTGAKAEFEEKKKAGLIPDAPEKAKP